MTTYLSRRWAYLLAYDLHKLTALGREAHTTGWVPPGCAQEALDAPWNNKMEVSYSFIEARYTARRE
jgi:hypothetical protein